VYRVSGDSAFEAHSACGDRSGALRSFVFDFSALRAEKSDTNKNQAPRER
jgi:hypothetical protein